MPTRRPSKSWRVDDRGRYARPRLERYSGPGRAAFRRPTGTRTWTLLIAGRPVSRCRWRRQGRSRRPAAGGDSIRLSPVTPFPPPGLHHPFQSLPARPCGMDTGCDVVRVRLEPEVLMSPPAAGPVILPQSVRVGRLSARCRRGSTPDPATAAFPYCRACVWSPTPAVLIVNSLTRSGSFQGPRCSVGPDVARQDAGSRTASLELKSRPLRLVHHERLADSTGREHEPFKCQGSGLTPRRRCRSPPHRRRYPTGWASRRRSPLESRPRCGRRSAQRPPEAVKGRGGHLNDVVLSAAGCEESASSGLSR